MLRIYFDEGETVCEEFGKKFVNDRLIKLMEDAIVEYVETYDDEERYLERITCQEDWEKPLEEIIDLDRLSQDERFFFDYINLNGLTPATVGPQRGLHDFFSLYRLLKAKKEYKPDLGMDYILFQLINSELDLCQDTPDLHKQVVRIPEPYRTEMAEEIQRTQPDDEGEGYVEFCLNELEDLEEYKSICFEDWDGFFLDDMDEEAMELSGLAEALGVNTEGERNTVIIEGNGQRVEFKIAPWEMEK